MLDEFEGMFSCFQFGNKRGAVSPFCPCAPLRENNYTDFLAIDEEGANAAAVVSVDGTVAVGITETNEVGACLWYGKRHFRGDASFVVEENIAFSCETFVSVGGKCLEGRAKLGLDGDVEVVGKYPDRATQTGVEKGFLSCLNGENTWLGWNVERGFCGLCEDGIIEEHGVGLGIFDRFPCKHGIGEFGFGFG